MKYKIIYNFKIIEYLFLLINLKRKNPSVLVFGMIIYRKIKKFDERSPMQGLEHETPRPLEQSFTTMPQCHA